MSLLKSMATVSGFTALSRVLGFIRDICMGFFLGSGHAADAFFAAFKFPNLFRRIFGEGAFNSAFVPLFGKELNEKGKKEAVQFASQTFSMLAIVLIIITAIAIPLMHWITMIHAPGFKAATTFSVTDSAQPQEVSFGINVRGAKSIYITVDNSGDAELKNATLLYKKKNIPIISSLLADNREKPEPVDLIKKSSEYSQAEWIKDNQWIKKITLDAGHKFNTLEGKALIHTSENGVTNFKIYRNHPETFNLTVTLSKITFIYLLCMALVAHLSGVLNTIKVFGMPAAAPALLNIIFLLGLLVATFMPFYSAAIVTSVGGSILLVEAVRNFITLIWSQNSMAELTPTVLIVTVASIAIAGFGLQLTLVTKRPKSKEPRVEE